MAPVAKKPVERKEARGRKEARLQRLRKEEEEEQGDVQEEIGKQSVLRRPAGATLKRPAGAIAAEEPSDEDDRGKEDGQSDEDEDEDDEKEALSVMRRPGMAVSTEGPSLAKRPAAASGDSEDDEDGKNVGDEEDEDDPVRPMKVSVDMLARQSANDLRKKRGALERLQKIRDVLAQKTRANNAAMRGIEKELEGTEAEAQKHGRAAARVKSSKAKAMAERQAARADSAKASANKAIKFVKKRADALKAAYESLKQKADFSENSVKRNQALLTAAEKECKDLAKQGFDVPKPGDTSDWAYSAPTAWHPKEVMAAKARHDAKQAMMKAKEAWEKVNAPAAAKKALWLAAQAKLDAARQKRKAIDEPSSKPGGKAAGGDVTDENVADGSHEKASAKGKAMKARKAGSVMKSMKAQKAMKAMKAMKA